MYTTIGRLKSQHIYTYILEEMDVNVTLQLLQSYMKINNKCEHTDWLQQSMKVFPTQGK